jgi:hypothetical protein
MILPDVRNNAFYTKKQPDDQNNIDRKFIKRNSPEDRNEYKDFSFFISVTIKHDDVYSH